MFLNDDQLQPSTLHSTDPSTSYATEPSTSYNTQKLPTILCNEMTNQSKNKKKGYDFSCNVETSKKKQIMNKTDCCIYCEQNITNFTRHIPRKHSEEMDVVRYNSFPKGSKERQILADELRKRGNFLNNVEGNTVIKPVRRPYINSISQSNASDYLPCKHCYGLFKKKYLFRHEKICKSVKVKQIGRNRAQSDA